MRCLLVDTSTKCVNIAISSDGELLYSLHRVFDKNLSECCLSLIDEALKSSNLTLHDIDKIFASVGPGSFTGIRIGLTILKVIAWSLKIDVVPISSLEIMASINCDSMYIVPFIDARRDNCFTGVYDKDLNVIENDKFISKDFINSKLDDSSYFVFSYDDKIYDVDFMKVINKHLNDDPINPHELNPNYLKLTEAEENLNKKNDC